MGSTNRFFSWDKLIGDARTFSLEARIFHAVCIVSCIGLLANVPFNYLIDLPELSLLMLLLFFMVAGIYYMARVKNKLAISVTFFNILCIILLIINYPLNSGINGPPPLVFFLACFIAIVIVPPRQQIFWIAVNIAVVTTMLTVQYLYPASVDNSYKTVLDRYLDMGYTYVFIVTFISWITIYIRKSYHSEKTAVEEKSRELDKNNKAKDKLFSILAHDLRSPLGSIQNFLEILTELDLDENEKRSIKKSLLNETKNTMQMLSNMLAWSKAQMEGVAAKLAEVNLVETLQLTLQIQHTVASEKRIRLNADINPGICIQADPDMLQMVIRNLINNAIKFTSSGGEININALIEANQCTIVISDNGIGIPLDDQKEIFSLNAKSTFGTQKEKGMGLGLLLCKEFTELQEGKIWFDSTPGKGTTFYVSFLLCSFEPKPNVQPAEENTTVV